MNAPLRRAGVVILVLFGLLFANLNWIQAYKADKYRNSPYNGRVQVADYSRPRGVIEASGEALAESKATDDRLKYLRTYPDKQAYAPIVGYKPVNGAATGIERSEDEFLAGRSDQLAGDRIAEMFTGDTSGGGNVLLTVNPRTQQTAYRELLNNQRNVGKGAAVAIDPRTGAIQAMVSMPSYDPNPLANHDPKAAQAAFDKLNKDSDKPLINRALGETLPPGSTFKTIIAAAALQNGYTEDTQIKAGSVYEHNGAIIRNAAEETCPGSEISLKEALTESCNTGFAQLGVALGADKLKRTAQAFGFEQTDLTVGNLDGDGLPVAASRTGAIANADGSTDEGALAQSAIGQRDVRMTPLQGALIAATVADGGQQMRPYLVQRLLASDRSQVYTANPKVLRRPIDGSVAGAMQDMMVSVVENGTGKRAQISGLKVGGKTGTAQNAVNANPHGWFIGFAIDEKTGQPVSAACVMLENVPGGHASAEAARIAGLIMKAAAGRGGD